MYGREKSAPAIVATKPTNNAGRPAADSVEPRAGAKGNADQPSTCRAQNRGSVSQALDRVQQSARLRKNERFTALLHHVSIDLLRMAFHALKRDAVMNLQRGVSQLLIGTSLIWLN
jgi:RNA-directed DNA polymerase